MAKRMTPRLHVSDNDPTYFLPLRRGRGEGGETWDHMKEER
jgi:hypothetical protein